MDRNYIDKLRSRLPKIEEKLSDPATSSNQRLFRELIKEHATLKKLSDKADAFFRLEDEIAEHRELIADASADAELKRLAESEIGELEISMGEAEKNLMIALLPPDENESRNAIVEIRAGTGGDEAALFAGVLYRMYTRFAESNNWKVSLIDASASEIGGYKEIMFSLEGSDVYRSLQYESGGHRVQRVPVTGSSGRIHTSAATVAVFPEAEPEDEIEIDPQEIRIDIFRSSGPGGQSVNTTDSAVRITHLPTGT